MRKIICFFVGHKLSSETDCGYDHCERCKQHEYYDGVEFEKFGWYFTIPNILYRRMWTLWWRILGLRRHIYTKCPDCGKLETFCGKYRGDHHKCLPF